jgi:hypothetical protein
MPKVSARKLIYDVARKSNILISGGSQTVRVIDMVSVINDAYEIVVENNIKLAETNSFVRDNLRKLEIKNAELKLDNKGDHYFAQYPDNLYKRLNHVVKASCKDCEGITKRIVPRIVQSDDLHDARSNPYRKANFAWEQLIADEAGDGLYLYTDDSCLTIDKITIDYYRQINYIQAPSLLECADYQYQNYDDELIVKDVDFDLDNTYISRKVTDVAALLLSADTKDTEGFNLKLQKILQVNNIT